MKIDLTKMQKRVDKCMLVFTRIVEELETEISTLKHSIDDNKQLIETAEAENITYGLKIDEYEALKGKVESIIK